RRRLVRRGGPVRRAENIPGGREAEPRNLQRAGDGTVGARRLVARRRRPARQHPFRRQVLAVLPEENRIAFLLALPQGQGRTQTPRSLYVRDGGEPLAAVRPVAAEGRAAEDALFP